MSNPTNPNPSRPTTTTNPNDVTRPLAPGVKPATRPAGVTPAGVDTNRARDANTTRASNERPVRTLSQPASTSTRGTDNPALMRSGFAADALTQEPNRNSPASIKGRHDASERRIKEESQASERATQLRNEHSTNVIHPEASQFERRAPGAIQSSVSRINGIVGRMGELVGTQPTTGLKAGENADTKAKAEYERLRGLLRLELDYLNSIGKSKDDPIPEPPAEPKLRL